MAKKNEVLIRDLKELAQHRDQQAIVAICVERDGTMRVVTYGENNLKCDAVAWWANGVDKEFSKIPFETIFGWGNGGVPKPLSPEDLEKALLMEDVPDYLYDHEKYKDLK